MTQSSLSLERANLVSGEATDGGAHGGLGAEVRLVLVELGGISSAVVVLHLQTSNLVFSEAYMEANTNVNGFYQYGLLTSAAIGHVSYLLLEL